MILFSNTVTSRLRYITDFIGKEITGTEIKITADKTEFQAYQGPSINYSDQELSSGEFRLKPHTLLFEDIIAEQVIHCFDVNGHKCFFKTEGDFPFDIFAAAFYLLSRYEEYLPHQKDGYGRYAYQNSLAWKEKFLAQPLINIWLKEFSQALKRKFPAFAPQETTFTFLPTYDIDMAWAYKHKGGWRNLGGIINDFFTANWKHIRSRVGVLSGKQQDPFDAYGWMNSLHERYHLKPYYFFLVADRRGKYDKNISPANKAMRKLIHDHTIRYPVGIHPSWRSGTELTLLKKEVSILSFITGSDIRSSRQHYIRFTLPGTFRHLISNGIQFDFSMGYGSINGFRASVCSPFFWYDLQNEKQNNLLLFPFCFMDANSFYEQKYSAARALEEMRQYYNAVRSVNGIFIMIWHNNFLGTGKLFIEWRKVYEQFIKEIRN